MKINNDIIDKVYVNYSTILRAASRAETLEGCAKIINDYLNHLKKEGLLNENVSVELNNKNYNCDILWYYKDELIVIKTVQELLCINDNNYRIYKPFIAENIDREHFKEHLSVITIITEDENGIYLLGRIKDRIRKVISEYQGLGLINWNLNISLHDECPKLKCVYTRNGKDFNVLINDLDEILDFKEDDFDYTENGIILNSKSDYSPLVVIDNNKLTVSGLLDCESDGFTFIDGDEKIELSETIERFMKGTKVDYKDYDDTFDDDDSDHKYSVEIPNVSITIFNAPNKVTKDEILEYKILSSIGGLGLDSEYHGYSEFSIEGFNVTLFKLNGNGGEHDLSRILELLDGQYVQFVMEVGINSEK